jgi:hypothetical protein
MGTIIVGIMIYKGFSLKTDFPEIVSRDEKVNEKIYPDFKPLPLPKNNERRD